MQNYNEILKLAESSFLFCAIRMRSKVYYCLFDVFEEVSNRSCTKNSGRLPVIILLNFNKEN